MWVFEISVNGPVKNSLSLGDISRILTSDAFDITCILEYRTEEK